MSGGDTPFEKWTYYLLALDPLHVGTGGYRLGRVDNAITREPGTNVPKIPGSSISGACRAYTAMAVQSKFPASQKYQRLRLDQHGKPIVQKDEKGNERKDSSGNPVFEYESCAGKGAKDGEGHCGKPDCEVCVPFGFSKQKESFQGLAQFSDARILLFPVHSMIGPVWITCPSILREFKIFCQVHEEKFKGTDSSCGPKLNFGWLMLERDDGPPPFAPDLKLLPQMSPKITIEDITSKRLFLVPDRLFSRIVNDNLEVRTSVAISPFTGAAESGALYSYEAIPRGCVLWLEVVYNKPEYFLIDSQPIVHGKGPGDGWVWVRENVEKGLDLFKSMGIGGMTTRGMGRVQILNL